MFQLPENPTHAKVRQQQRAMWVLRVHYIAYFIGWALAIYALARLNPASDSFSAFTHLIALILLWTPILALHTAMQAFSSREHVAAQQASYRQGYADALRQLTERAFSEQAALDAKTEQTETRPNHSH